MRVPHRPIGISPRAALGRRRLPNQRLARQPGNHRSKPTEAPTLRWITTRPRKCAESEVLRSLTIRAGPGYGQVAMRYIDSGTRDPTQALGSWFEAILRDGEISELRWQAGYYTADGLGFLAPTLARIRDQGGRVTALIGSNNGDTLRFDVERLALLLGVPRREAKLGVVSYAGSFFHPKTYHLTRRDGGQAAYVGSANLTFAGVGSLHVEAGVVLDTRDGDSAAQLGGIRDAIDGWFSGTRDGLIVVDALDVIDRLVVDGVLAELPPPRAQIERGAGNAAAGHPPRPRLRPLIAVPDWGDQRAPDADEQGSPKPDRILRPTRAPGARRSTARPGLPDYLRFAPDAQTPTRGLEGLTGYPLPNDAVGLILRLSRDTTRLFAGRPGTANVSIPVNALGTLRFGLYRRAHERARAEFSLRARYVGPQHSFIVGPVDTNVMTYGYGERETGHRDVRMLVPAALRELALRAQDAGLAVPTDGDVALLEWPTEVAPEFRLTLMERGSPLMLEAQALFDTAARAGTLIGDGACWLPPGLSPSWPS